MALGFALRPRFSDSELLSNAAVFAQLRGLGRGLRGEGGRGE